MNRTLLKNELARDEGKHLESYQDSVGLWTIGIGHLLGTRQRMAVITDAECSALFASDVLWAEQEAIRIVSGFSVLDDVRQRAIVNMVFNLGHRLEGFTKFLAAVAVENWDEAARQMMDSRWATQVGNRAKRLEHMIRTGEVAA